MVMPAIIINVNVYGNILDIKFSKKIYKILYKFHKLVIIPVTAFINIFTIADNQYKIFCMG